MNTLKHYGIEPDEYEYKEDDEVVNGIIGVIVRRGAAVSCCE